MSWIAGKDEGAERRETRPRKLGFVLYDGGPVEGRSREGGQRQTKTLGQGLSIRKSWRVPLPAEVYSA